MTDATDLETLRRGTSLVKRGFAQMQKGGVIMDVVNREQARIAEEQLMEMHPMMRQMFGNE